MKVKVHGKDIDVSPKTEEKIQERLSFLEKYLLIADEDVAECILKKAENNKIRLEVTIGTKVGILRAEVTDNDLTTAMDEVCDRLERQLVDQKGRLNRRHKSSLAKAFVEIEEKEEEENTIPVRTKRVIADKMSLDEAILQMEMLGHTFFVYTDEDDDMVNIVYRRTSGGYGVIEVQE